MIGNRFTISSIWDWRPESAREIGDKFLKTLDALSAINPHFQSWEIVDHAGEPKETGFALADVRTRFTEIVKRGVWPRDGSKPLPAGGYLVSACNTIYSGPTSVSLSAEGGGDARFRRGARFSTSYDKIPDPSIVAYPVFKSVLTTLVSIWGVSRARAFSWDLMQYWDDPPFDFDLNWMIYLSAPLARRITPPKGILVERTDDGGLYLIAAEETFDTENPKHLAAALRIRDALAPINDLPQHERDKQRKDEAERHIKSMGPPGIFMRRNRKPLPS